MDLISRKAAIEAIKDPVVKGFAMYALKSAPAVPAVPLDKLCEWLEEHHEYYSYFVMDRFAWRKALTEWMEEQDEQKEANN